MGHRGMPRFMDGDEYSVLDRVRPPGCARPLAYSRSLRERELQPCPALPAFLIAPVVRTPPLGFLVGRGEDGGEPLRIYATYMKNTSRWIRTSLILG